MYLHRPILFLKPGEILFTKNPVKVITVLGSCVSVIMHYRSKSTGAICHAVMPSCTQSGKRRDQDAFHYVDRSIAWMLSQFEKNKIDIFDIEVKIYGGAEMLSQNVNCSSIAVGKRNIEAAIKIIENRKLKLKDWNVGGNKGRKLIFYTDTGDVITNNVGRQIFTPMELIKGGA